MQELIDFYGDPIAVYTRAEAIADGALVDVSTWARELGYLVPTAITHGLCAEIERLRGDDVPGATRYLLFVARLQAQRQPGEELVELLVSLGGEWLRVWLELDGDGATLMRPEDH